MATIFINVSIANALSGCAISPEVNRPTNIIEEFSHASKVGQA